MKVDIEYKISYDDMKKGLLKYYECSGRKKKNLTYTCIFVVLSLLNIISFFATSMVNFSTLVIGVLCAAMAFFVFTESKRYVKRCTSNFDFDRIFKTSFDDEKIILAVGGDSEKSVDYEKVQCVLCDDMIIMVTENGAIYQYLKKDFSDGDYKKVKDLFSQKAIKI